MKTLRRRHTAAGRYLCLSTILLTACTTSEPYQKPEMEIPAAWSSPTPTPTQQTISPIPWWHSLHDQTLNHLMEKALQNNHDLKIAEARINEARAIRGKSLSKLLPDISASASSIREGEQSSLGGLNTPTTNSQIGVNASWDIDLFGGTRSELEAADAEIHNAEANYQQVILSLQAELARTYIEARTLQQLRTITQKNLTLEQETLRTTKLQFAAQAISKLDVLRAQGQVETTAAKLPTIDANINAANDRIAVLVGTYPVGSVATAQELMPIDKLPEFPSAIILATPISVLANRPDVKAAEYKLMEATALKNSAIADLFPKISISGFFGAGTSTLFAASNPWSLGANAMLSLLNFGRIESQIDVADAQKQQAFHAYKQSILKAVEDVENSLSAYNNELKRAKTLQKAADSYREASRLARIKYQAGDATFLDELIAEERVLDAETSALISRSTTAKNAVALYIAMGTTTTTGE